MLAGTKLYLTGIHHGGIKQASVVMLENLRPECSDYGRLSKINSTCRTQLNRIPALESVRLDTIRKYFRKFREYMKAYREGKSGGAHVKSAVHLYKSHRHVLGNDIFLLGQKYSLLLLINHLAEFQFLITFFSLVISIIIKMLLK